MNKFIKSAVGLAMGLVFFSPAFGGNPDRVGQAGAYQLLINPWAKSAGWGGANVAGINGVEAMQFNVAGLVNNPENTEFIFSRTNWLGGSSVGININSFGFSTKLGSEKSNAIGATVTSFDFGDIPLTTVNNPDPTGITYSIQMLNFGLAYAHQFSNSISGGILFRGVSEGISSASSSGIALDAGIQYVTGKFNQAKFGISLKNVGPPMAYSGSGLSVRGVIDGTENSLTLQSRSEDFEMPSLLQIGGSYDFIFGGDTATRGDHILTVAATFASNAFDKDQGIGGVQYSFKNIFAVRAGYTYESGLLSETDRTKALLGPSAGASVYIPFGKDKSKRFGVDYAFRSAGPFTGQTHSFGARLNF